MTTHHTFITYLPLSEEETQIEVSFDFYPPCRGSRDKYGVPLEPDDPLEIYITEVIDKETGESLLPLQPTTYFALENLCLEHMNEVYDNNHSDN